MYSAFLLLLGSALLARAGITQDDFTGIGNIYVLKSDDWRNATPKAKVGCLNDQGKFVSDADDCGVFSRFADYPYTLASRSGNCTFNDQTQEKNKDSLYGSNDVAWNCDHKLMAKIYDELYTIEGFPYVFLCFGDLTCYYDAKRLPKEGETLPLWQYRWGSQQLGITPGHVQLQLMWNRLGDLPKREGDAGIPSPRMRVSDDVQVPLLGEQART